MEVSAGLAAARAELKRIERELGKILDLYLKEAMSVEMVKERSSKLEARRAELTATLASSEEPPPVLHPSMAVVYRERIHALPDRLRRSRLSAIRSRFCGL